MYIVKGVPRTFSNESCTMNASARLAEQCRPFSLLTRMTVHGRGGRDDEIVNCDDFRSKSNVPEEDGDAGSDPEMLKIATFSCGTPEKWKHHADENLRY